MEQIIQPTKRKSGVDKPDHRQDQAYYDFKENSRARMNETLIISSWKINVRINLT